MKQELADGLTIRKSRIHGNGCFATIPFSKGRKVAHYAGERITWEEASRRRRNHNGHRICDLNSNLSIDGSFGGNGTEHINHSCEPNCEAREEDGRVFIFALRDIRRGEELFYDYGLVVDDRHTPALKRAYETLVKDLPEDQKDNVIAQLARTTRRAVARSQSQHQGKGEAVTA